MKSTDITVSVMPYIVLDETYPLFIQFLGNGDKFLGHDVYQIPFITYHPHGEWMDPE